uniref:Uncharacterized protein n=1 Tax=Solanum tuberosum TaxID=4113 RepID=M1BYM6_SOLTU
MGSYRELMEKANVPWRSQDVEVEGPKNIDLFSLKDALTTAKKSKTTSTTRTSQSDELVPKVPLISESPSNSEPSIIQATSVGTLQVINAKLDKILKNQEEHAQTEKMTQFRKEWSHRVQEAEEDLDKATDGTRPSDKDLDDDTIDDALLFYRSTQAPEIEVSCSE